MDDTAWRWASFAANLGRLRTDSREEEKLQRWEAGFMTIEAEKANKVDKPPEESKPMGPIDIKDAIQIRLKLVEVTAQTALEYAALAAGIAVVWATILGEAGDPGNGSPVWLIEGAIAAVGVHLVLNAAYYGRMAGLIGGWMLGENYEVKDDFDDPPLPTNGDDTLSRINYRYTKKTREKKSIKYFGNVISVKLLFFIAAGMAVGLIMMII